MEVGLFIEWFIQQIRVDGGNDKKEVRNENGCGYRFDRVGV